ncbi:hypothetical protein [Chryseobacterium viscerum]|uniref:Uncharacterized protein n=1 Tax=Chryseobacterium viscerum TaxID=1037377 RepID=A0A316X015_9FLAO|nr:hypothetical protein [Chryseobacterium viscerum]KAB1231349.1 hypothetical protein F8D52_05955 [Chryseobacterium viscerum]PWN64230.1 hypothetical protein C1634_006440 [Chryseobacterium viscerum]
MEENNKFTQREELKTYFETGKYPTQSQFGQFIDNYVHLNEFNFGLEVKASGNWKGKNYHFYVAENIQNSGRGHLNIEDDGTGAPKIDKYKHVLSGNVKYKFLHVKLSNDLDIDKYQPQIIIKRYKQKKRLQSGRFKDAGYYKERPLDAKSLGRQSEYPVTSNEMVIDINPINYFRPNASLKEFYPSGTFNRPGSFRYSVHHRKPFSLIQMLLEINVNGKKYRSAPVNIKIILGRDDTDVINYIID